MKHFKLFFALFAMLALGVGNAWGETVTFTPDNCTNWTSSQAEQTQTIDGITLHSTGAANNTQLRLYSGATHTFTSTVGNITSILFTCTANGTSNYGPGKMTGDGYVAGTEKTGEWTGNSAEVTLTGGQSRCTSIVVTYTPSSGGGETPDPTPDPEPEPEPDPDPTPGTGETWTLVTNASNLKVGDQIVIAATESDYALGTTQNTNNRVAVSVTKGTNTITIGDDVQIITLETGKVANTFAFNTGSGYLYAASSSANNLKTKADLDNNGSWAISITSEGVATIKAQGTYTRNWIRKNSSSAIFSCYGSGQKDVAIYKKVTSSGGDEPSTPTPSVTLDPSVKDFGTVNVGETPSQEFTITAENTTATLSASIDNTTDYAVSAITGDKVTVTYQPQSAGTHSAVLTVKAGEEATATVNLTGKAVQALEGTWILVTDASSLKAGDEIIIAAKESDVALSITQANNNRPEVAITKNDNTIAATSETQVLTLQAGNKENTLALYTGDGYLYAASSGSNWLRTETTLTDNSSWTISIADGTATLIAQGTNTRNTLYYNKNNKIFSCYSNAQQPIALYKNTNGQQLAGLAYATTKYLTKLGDSFTTPTLTNPNSLTVTYSSSDNNVATVDNTGTVTIKAAGVVVITAAFAGDASYLEGSAKYTLCVTEHAGTEADPYSVADARRVIDVMETAEGVYAKGLVSEIVTAYNSEYGNITYNISVDGTTTGDQLQAYRGKSYNGTNFTSAEDIKVGDEVVIKGTLKKYSTTYEFDENNQLVSLNRTKEQAGLAYAETEHTANVGEDFAEPALTNLNNLTVTYSSSNTTLATVNATTGEVTILAAGKVTITATTAGDATYAAGSASYTITISNPAMAVATLPFAFNSGKAAIETTAGMTQNGLGSDYGSAPLLKFDGTGDYVIIHFNGEPGKLSYDIKGNSYSDGTFTVQESEDGSAYTNIVEYTELGSTETKTHTLAATSRYVKFIYTEKVNGNVALGNIKIALPEEEPGEGGGETPGERLTEWVLTPLADITTNDLVVITMTKGETTWAMTNDNGTSAAPAAPVVTLSADALAAEPAENLKWVVSNNNGTLTIYPYGDYETWLYCTNTNNGVKVGTGDAKEFTINGNYLYTSQTEEARYIGVYNSQDWRCYKLSSGAIATNIADQTLAFYVKKNANDVLPGTGEEPGDDPVVPTPTINPTATFIFNTDEGLTNLGITYPATEDEDNAGAYKTEFENNATFTQDGITMTTTGGTTVATRVWLTATGKLDLRVYKGATLTFSVPENLQITTIAFNGSNINHLLVDGVAVNNNTWTGSKQEITFTAKEDASTIKINTIDIVVSYTRSISANYGTICLPYGSSNYSGAEFYEFVGKEPGKVWLASVDKLEAGVPYVFMVKGTQLVVAYEGTPVSDPGKHNGLHGTFTDNTPVEEGNYIISQGKVLAPCGTGCYVNANRAYVVMDEIPADGKPTQQMPGRKYIGMDVQGENEATGLDNNQLPITNIQKAIENGQLIIIRDGVRYNIQGQVIK